MSPRDRAYIFASRVEVCLSSLPLPLERPSTNLYLSSYPMPKASTSRVKAKAAARTLVVDSQAEFEAEGLSPASAATVCAKLITTNGNEQRECEYSPSNESLLPNIDGALP